MQPSDAFSVEEIENVLRWYVESKKHLVKGRLAGKNFYFVVDQDHNVCSSLTEEYANALWKIAYIEFPALISSKCGN